MPNHFPHLKMCFVMDKLQLTGQNLGLLFDFRSTRVDAVHLL
jgi:hypothetical protein